MLKHILFIYKARATPRIPTTPANPAAIAPLGLEAPADLTVEAAAPDAELAPAATPPLVELPPVGAAMGPELVIDVVDVIEMDVDMDVDIALPAAVAPLVVLEPPVVTTTTKTPDDEVAVALALARPELSAAAPAARDPNPW